MTNWGKVFLVLGILAVLAVVTPYTNSFVILLVTRALILAILAMSLDVLLGFTGLASLGQAAYLGVGAYLTAILATKYGFGLGWGFTCHRPRARVGFDAFAHDPKECRWHSSCRRFRTPRTPSLPT